MAKGHALFNLPQRRHTPNGMLTAEPEDLEAVKELLKGVLEVNRLGFPPYVYIWYTLSLRQLLENTMNTGITRPQLSQSYYSQFKTRLSDKARRRLITVLEEVGFIEERTDPADRRTTRLYPPWVGGETKKKYFTTSDTR
jgi:hypothetical protein